MGQSTIKPCISHFYSLNSGCTLLQQHSQSNCQGNSKIMLWHKRNKIIYIYIYISTTHKWITERGFQTHGAWHGWCWNFVFNASLHFSSSSSSTQTRCTAFLYTASINRCSLQVDAGTTTTKQQFLPFIAEFLLDSSEKFNITIIWSCWRQGNDNVHTTSVQPFKNENKQTKN